MEENTDTIPIPVLDVERKTVPVFCPWGDIISGVAKTDVMRFDKISPAYKACRKCKEFHVILILRKKIANTNPRESAYGNSFRSI